MKELLHKLFGVFFKKEQPKTETKEVMENLKKEEPAAEEVAFEPVVVEVKAPEQTQLIITPSIIFQEVDHTAVPEPKKKPVKKKTPSKKAIKKTTPKKKK